MRDSTNQNPKSVLKDMIQSIRVHGTLTICPWLDIWQYLAKNARSEDM